MSHLIGRATKIDYPVEHIGGKTRGLIQLYRHFDGKEHYGFFVRQLRVPDFFVVPVDYLNLGDDVVRSADALQTDKFAVRSSSPLEDGNKFSFDGCFDTYLDVDRKELLDAIKGVRASARGERAQRYARDFGIELTDNMAIVVQQMIKSSLNGIIYSKFPASQDIIRIISHGNPQKNAVIRRWRFENGPAYGHVINEDTTIDRGLAYDLASVSLSVENAFGHPVRIEYLTDYNCEIMYLVQARPVIFDKDMADIALPDFTDDELLVTTHDVNGTGDFTLPAVVIATEHCDNLPFYEVRSLDAMYPDGYILLCDYLKFGTNNYDEVTRHKKAFVYRTAVLTDEYRHNIDIARQKGMLCLGTKNFVDGVGLGEINIKTGDLLRIVSDGIAGKLYKIRQKQDVQQ